MRSIWIGSMSFGLVNIPIKLFSAVQESSLDLDMLDSNDHSNIKFKRVNENTGKEKARGKKISVPKMKVVHRQNDNSMDMLKASLAGSKRKSA